MGLATDDFRRWWQKHGVDLAGRLDEFKANWKVAQTDLFLELASDRDAITAHLTMLMSEISTWFDDVADRFWQSFGFAQREAAEKCFREYQATSRRFTAAPEGVDFLRHLNASQALLSDYCLLNGSLVDEQPVFLDLPPDFTIGSYAKFWIPLSVAHQTKSIRERINDKLRDRGKLIGELRDTPFTCPLLLAVGIPKNAWQIWVCGHGMWTEGLSEGADSPTWRLSAEIYRRTWSEILRSFSATGLQDKLTRARAQLRSSVWFTAKLIDSMLDPSSLDPSSHLLRLSRWVDELWPEYPGAGSGNWAAVDEWKSMNEGAFGSALQNWLAGTIPDREGAKPIAAMLRFLVCHLCSLLDLRPVSASAGPSPYRPAIAGVAGSRAPQTVAQSSLQTIPEIHLQKPPQKPPLSPKLVIEALRKASEIDGSPNKATRAFDLVAGQLSWRKLEKELGYSRGPIQKHFGSWRPETQDTSEIRDDELRRLIDRAIEQYEAFATASAASDAAASDADLKKRKRPNGPSGPTKLPKF